MHSEELLFSFDVCKKSFTKLDTLKTIYTNTVGSVCICMIP